MVFPQAQWQAPSAMLSSHRVDGAGGQLAVPKLLPDWLEARSAGCGLVNLGNSCFLNSVLQCLAHLPPLANLCMVQAHRRACPGGPTGGPCICCLLEGQVARMLSKPAATPDAPRALFNALPALNRGFVRGSQEDAHELLRCLTDAMERCLLRQAGLLGPGPRAPMPKCPKTLVNALFQGILQSQVTCLRCGHVSRSHDPCMDLSLDLRGCDSLEACLRAFTAVERLEGDNAYRCEGCKQLVPARKQMTVWDDPNVLVVHLKRFDGIFGGKIDRPIKFPPHLNLEPFMCSSRQVQQQQQQQQQQHSNGWGNNGSSLGGASSSSSLSCGYANGGGSSSSSGYGYNNNYGHCSGNGAAGWHAGGSAHGWANGSSDDGGGTPTSSNGSGGSVCVAAGGKQQQRQQQQAAAGAPPLRRATPGHYVLRGVLVHSGLSAHSGHYYAYVKDGESREGFWHCMNDSSVYRVNAMTVLSQSAYMLFYVRASMKQQADLPGGVDQQQQQQQQQAGPAGGRLKRGSSETGSGASGAAAAAAAVLGPQLPPHLAAKRQKLMAQQQQAQQQAQQEEERGGGGGEEDEDEEQPRVMYGPALPPHLQPLIGPELPPHLRQQQQDADVGADDPAGGAGGAGAGQQRPPGWKPSTGACSSSQAAVGGTTVAAAAAAAAGSGGGSSSGSADGSSSPAVGDDAGAAPVLQQQQQPADATPDAAHASAPAQAPREPAGPAAAAAAAVTAAAAAAAPGGGSNSLLARWSDPAAMRDDVWAALQDRRGEVGPWLHEQVLALRAQGASHQECRGRMLGALRAHEVVQGVAHQFMQQLVDAVHGAFGGGGRRPAPANGQPQPQQPQC